MEKQIWIRKKPILSMSLSQETIDTITTIATIVSIPKSRVVDDVFKSLTLDAIIDIFNIKKEKSDGQ